MSQEENNDLLNANEESSDKKTSSPKGKRKKTTSTNKKTSKDNQENNQVKNLKSKTLAQQEGIEEKTESFNNPFDNIKEGDASPKSLDSTQPEQTTDSPVLWDEIEEVTPKNKEPKEDKNISSVEDIVSSITPSDIKKDVPTKKEIKPPQKRGRRKKVTPENTAEVESKQLEEVEVAPTATLPSLKDLISPLDMEEEIQEAPVHKKPTKKEKTSKKTTKEIKAKELPKEEIKEVVKEIKEPTEKVKKKETKSSKTKTKNYPKITLPTKNAETLSVETPKSSQNPEENVSAKVNVGVGTPAPKHKLSAEQVAKAKKIGVVLGVLLALAVFGIVLLPKFKETLSNILPEKEEEKPLILGDDPPVKKEETGAPTENKGAMGSTPDGNTLNISEEESATIVLDTSGTTSRVKILPENRGISASISTPTDNISLGQTKLPERENQFCVIETEIDKVEKSKINPKRRYISIIHPDSADKRIIVESSTSALVELLDQGSIKPGDKARITLGYLDKKMQERYKEERNKISKLLDTDRNNFYSVEEYQIISIEKKKE
jgi:hypothetical protein